jgi:hypothetical protein
MRDAGTYVDDELDILHICQRMRQSEQRQRVQRTRKSASNAEPILAAAGCISAAARPRRLDASATNADGRHDLRAARCAPAPRGCRTGVGRECPRPLPVMASARRSHSGRARTACARMRPCAPAPQAPACCCIRASVRPSIATQQCMAMQGTGQLCAPRPRAATSVASMMGWRPLLNSAITQSRSGCVLSPCIASAGQPSMRSCCVSCDTCDAGASARITQGLWHWAVRDPTMVTRCFCGRVRACDVCCRTTPSAAAPVQGSANDAHPVAGFLGLHEDEHLAGEIVPRAALVLQHAPQPRVLHAPRKRSKSNAATQNRSTHNANTHIPFHIPAPPPPSARCGGRPLGPGSRW